MSVLELRALGGWMPMRAVRTGDHWFVLASGGSGRLPIELLRSGKVEFRSEGRTRWAKVVGEADATVRAAVLAEFRRRSGEENFQRWYPRPGRLLELTELSEVEPLIDDAYGGWLRAEFEQGAAGYASRIAANPVEAGERRRTAALLQRWFPTPRQLVELGSGPGPETLPLLAAGHEVTAVDVSQSALDGLRDRAAAAGVDGRLRTVRLRLTSLARLEGGPFQGGYSTFGALNCEPELGPVAQGLATLLRPGALFVAGVFNVLAAPEFVGGFATGRWRRATARAARPVPAEGSRFGIDWFAGSVPRVRRAFRPWFDLEWVVGVGVVLPPPDAVERWPGLAPLVPGLDRLDASLGRFRLFAALADQLLIGLRRREGND